MNEMVQSLQLLYLLASARDFVRIKFDVLSYGNRTYSGTIITPSFYATLQSISVPNFTQIRSAV